MYKQFYGAQDEYISKLIPDRLCGTFIKTMKYVIEAQQNIQSHNTLYISSAEDAVNGYGYTNFKIMGDTKKIHSVELVIGGQRFDKIYPSLTQQMTFSIFNTNILPALTLHDYKINIEHSETVTIYIEKVKLTQPFIEKDKAEIIYSSIQYTGEEKLKNGINHIKMCFNHPIKKIFILSTTELYSLQLQLNDFIIYSCNFPNMINDMYEYTFLFEKPLNFSRIENPILEVGTETYSSIHVVAESQNVATMTNEMIGIRFSK
jgi:hypothetical protein